MNTTTASKKAPSVKSSLELARSLARGENPFTDMFIWYQARDRGFVTWDSLTGEFKLAPNWAERVALYGRKSLKAA